LEHTSASYGTEYQLIFVWDKNIKRGREKEGEYESKKGKRSKENKKYKDQIYAKE
jgi:hypothetical protein